MRFNPSPSLRPLTRFAVQLSTKKGIEKELARLGGCFRCFYLMEVLMHVGLWRERLTDPSAAPHALSSLFTPDMTASVSPASDLWWNPTSHRIDQNSSDAHGILPQSCANCLFSVYPFLLWNWTCGSSKVVSSMPSPWQAGSHVILLSQFHLLKPSWKSHFLHESQAFPYGTQIFAHVLVCMIFSGYLVLLMVFLILSVLSLLWNCSLWSNASIFKK